MALRAVRADPARALGLIRVSKERDGMLSPDLQRVAITDHAARTGRQITHWLEGIDESGSQSRSRWWAKLDQAVTMVETGQVDAVIVWKFSRTARHRRRWAVALDRVETAGGCLESATEQVDVTTSTGRLTRGMLAELAAWEAEVKGEQWRETHAHRLERGLPHTAYPRLGYQLTDGAYVPDPDTAPVVADLYDRYLGGAGFRPLVDHLNRLGIVQPRTGRGWTVRGVAYFLGTGFAAGLLNTHDPDCGCKTPSGCPRRLHRPGAHEPIIDAQTWEAYRRVRTVRAAAPPRTLTPTTVLAGLVRCAGCGYAMRVKADRDHGPGHRYRCETHGCPAPASALRSRCEAAARAWLAEQVADVDAAARAALASAEAKGAARVEVEHLARQATRVEQALTRLTTDLARGLVPESAYISARDELLVERAALLERTRDREDVQARPVPDGPRIRGLLVDWDRLPVTARRDMLRELLRVHVARSAGHGRPPVRVVGTWET